LALAITGFETSAYAGKLCSPLNFISVATRQAIYPPGIVFWAAYPPQRRNRGQWCY
jgi:hypothetical protein